VCCHGDHYCCCLYTFLSFCKSATTTTPPSSSLDLQNAATTPAYVVEADSSLDISGALRITGEKLTGDREWRDWGKEREDERERDDHYF
jgi:chitodextrinase